MDEVDLEVVTVLGAARAASQVAVEDLVVGMEAVVVEVSAADMVDLPLATILVGRRYLQTHSLTTQLPVQKEAKRYTFATFVSCLCINICRILMFDSSPGLPAMTT